MMQPSIRTTVVGSYPVPDWLKSLPNEETMVDAMTVAMRAQELAGIDVIADGEIGRWNLQRNAPGGMVERFVEPMEGVQWRLTRQQAELFRSRAETAYRSAAPGIVRGPIGSGMLDLKREWDRARALTHCPLKFTVTSPYMMAKVLADDYYHDRHQLALAFADVLAQQLRGVEADVVQVDEPNLPGSPEDSEVAAEAINIVLAAVQPGQKAVHLCFGNYGGQTIQRGDYARLIGFCNTLRCDHLVLETSRRPREEIVALKEITPPVMLGIGVIDVKDLQIETPEQVARRIETLSELVGPGRIGWVHPDCGLRMLPRAVADGKLRALVVGRDLFWGARP